MPLPISIAPRLAALSRSLGVGTISIMIDSPAQLLALPTFPFPPMIFLKLDTGYHRAGLPPFSPEFEKMVDATLTAQSQSLCSLKGFYSHASHSYASKSSDDAMMHLVSELSGVAEAAKVVRARPLAWVLKERTPETPLLLSVGATPSATSAQNLVAPSHAASKAAHTLRQTLDRLAADQGCRVELHAGVYPFLDLQQLSTQASPSSADASALSPKDVAFSVLADVASTYPARSPPRPSLLRAASPSAASLVRAIRGGPPSPRGGCGLMKSGGRLADGGERGGVGGWWGK
jgi:D-serine ammonia-lyase